MIVLVSDSQTYIKRSWFPEYYLPVGVPLLHATSRLLPVSIAFALWTLCVIVGQGKGGKREGLRVRSWWQPRQTREA